MAQSFPALGAPVLSQGAHTAGAHCDLADSRGRLHPHFLQVGLHLLGAALVDIHPVVGDLIAEYGGLAA